MFEEIAGIPAHPLLVHAAVVFVPLQVLAAIGYALVPASRRFLGWVAIALAVAAPLAALTAKLSGDAFRDRMVERGTVSDEILASIDQHSDYGVRTVLTSAALGILLIGLVVVNAVRARRADGGQPGAGFMALAIVLTVGVLGAGGAAGYFVYQSGDSGATMVWSGL